MKEDLVGKTVVVGLSGGVDSSVAAALLKERGAKVVGLFMKNWEEKDERGNCLSSLEYEDVEKVCDVLDIPHYTVDFVKEYWDNVFVDFLEGYKKGFTPNPDILCNREIKFKAFFNKAMDLGADYLATGHYCQIDRSNPKSPKLIKGTDFNKDQTYFLYTINDETLKRVLFPIGHLEKSKVRELANKFNLPTENKKDSTGICFIGERNFRPFLSNFLTPKKGSFLMLDGSKVGEHNGAHFYTLGQRKGLGLGGPGEPWFVVGKDIEKNILYVERGERHPALYYDELEACELSWVDQSFVFKKGEVINLMCKARYRQEDQKCQIESRGAGEVLIKFDIPQRAVTIGQSIVFYTKNECLGGGFISKLGENYDQMNKYLPEIVAR